MLKSGGVRCRYCNESIYIPSMGNLRDIIKRHEDKCPDNPNRKTPEHREYLEYKREIMLIDEKSAAKQKRPEWALDGYGHDLADTNTDG